MGELTAEQVSRILGSLEAPRVLRAAMDVAGELLGPCVVDVFSFSLEDREKVIRFGVQADDGSPIPAGDGVDFEGSAGPVPSDAPGVRRWRMRRPLKASEGLVGVLDITVDGEPQDPRVLAKVDGLATVVALAVRNTATFEETKRLTFTDDLTALYNSRFMALYLDRELKRCRRTRASLSLLFMDLDGFKNVNDTHGHLAGSRTLVEIGAVLERTVRDADVLIRYGGDEFVILCPETPLAGGLVIGERIRKVIEGTRFLESQGIEARVSASIGIAAYPESADDVRGLISCADRAMYDAKARGKNRIVAASPLSSPESLKRR